MLEPVRRLAASIACALGLVLATFGSAHDHPAATPESQAPFYAEMATADATMHRDMTIASSGDVDRDFLRMMIPHHQGAIDRRRAGRGDHLHADPPGRIIGDEVRRR